MNQQSFKTARISSCSTKKSSNNGAKSQSKAKKNLQSTFTKMSLPCTAMANSSVLTQRINTHNKCKGVLSNPESQNTLRVKQSNKKLPKAISKMKTDRKAEYTKLKAKQIEAELEIKQSSGKKSFKKTHKDSKMVLNDNKPLPQGYYNLEFASNLGKISTFIPPQSDHLTQIKHNSASVDITEISKKQKQLIEKIASLQQQNCTFTEKNESVINEIKYKHQEEVTSLKEEMKILTSRLNQQGNKNIVLQKKSENTEKDYASLRQKIHQKDQRILYLERQNTSLQQELKVANNSAINYENHVSELSAEIANLKSVKSEVQEQLKKCQKQKLYIKENCSQVLSLLREEFGEELKLFSF